MPVASLTLVLYDHREFSSFADSIKRILCNIEHSVLTSGAEVRISNVLVAPSKLSHSIRSISYGCVVEGDVLSSWFQYISIETPVVDLQDSLHHRARNVHILVCCITRDSSSQNRYLGAVTLTCVTLSIAS